MEAIVLAGGFGTRLRHLVPDVPKPMAPVYGHPFLKYIFDYLLENGITHIVLATGYKSEAILSYFGDEYRGTKITYSNEDTPLGTGGAIKKALGCCEEKNVFIINGDTYFDVNLNHMKQFHTENNCSVSIAVKSMKNFERYGAVIIEASRITKFEEKKPTAEGKINGGIYLVDNKIVNSVDAESFSFEKEVLETGLVDIYAFESNGYFIDIGVPEDYYKAQIDFEKLQKSRLKVGSNHL
jgi:NDP-sugar pyrophosphorylase family protein